MNTQLATFPSASFLTPQKPHRTKAKSKLPKPTSPRRKRKQGAETVKVAAYTLTESLQSDIRHYAIAQGECDSPVVDRLLRIGLMVAKDPLVKATAAKHNVSLDEALRMVLEKSIENLLKDAP